MCRVRDKIHNVSYAFYAFMPCTKMSTIKCMRNDDENFGPLDIKIAKATRVWKLWYLRHHRMNREREESQVSIDFPRLCDSNQYTSDSYLYEYILMLKHAHTHTHTNTHTHTQTHTNTHTHKHTHTHTHTY